MTRASRHAAFRPAVERLEDRTVPSLVPAAGPFQVSQEGQQPFANAYGLASAADGTFVVAFQSSDESKVLATVYNPDGSVRAGPLQVNQGTAGNAIYPRVAMDG